MASSRVGHEEGAGGWPMSLGYNERERRSESDGRDRGRGRWAGHFVTSKQVDYPPPPPSRPQPKANLHLYDSHFSFKTNDVSYLP